MTSWDDYLKRWEHGGVLDASTAERIRAFEAQQQNKQPERRWQVTVLLALGIILLVGGMMLFVAAHWDQVGPWQRLALVLGFLAAFHAFAAICSKRFPGMATTLHGVGTAGAGAAILTVGTIFNMQEHWPTAVLLWALCAAAGWWLLRDQVQQTLALLLVPTWVICEWSFRAEGYAHTGVYEARMSAVVAAVMLTAFLRTPRKGVFWALYISGALGLLCSIPALADGWLNWPAGPMAPVSLRIASACIILAALAGVWLWDKRAVLPVAMVALLVYLLPWLRDKGHYFSATNGTNVWQPDQPGLMMYVCVAAVCIAIVWWGLQQKSRAIVNYAIGAFALTVLWFYFSSLMDKLGRSLGLIGLGIVFLAGGWGLEKLRRRLLGKMHEVNL